MLLNRIENQHFPRDLRTAAQGSSHSWIQRPIRISGLKFGREGFQTTFSARFASIFTLHEQGTTKFPTSGVSFWVV
jgi:hypothetical protein